MVSSPPTPRNRKTAYAFFIQHCRQKYEEKHNGGTPDNFTTFMRECGSRWDEMRKADKEPFEKLAAEDKVRYENELQKHPNRPSTSKSKSNKKRKFSRDENEPRHALPSFYWFCQDHRDAVKSEHPDLHIGEVSLELGRRWISAGSDVRAIYETKAKEDSVRYEKELNLYKKHKDEQSGNR